LGFTFFPVGILGTFAQLWSCRKYALALYITTVQRNALELVEAGLQQVCGAAETNLVFAHFHKDPSVSNSQGESNRGNFQEHQVH
jgi:hypothetical protein